MSFFDTRILIRKCGTITSLLLSLCRALTQRARKMPPAALLMELKREAQIKRCCSRRLSDVDAVHNSPLRNRFQFPAVYCKASRVDLNFQTVCSSAQKLCARWTWSTFAQALASCASTPADMMAWPSDLVQLKIDQYVAQPPISRASCLTCWWAEHKTSYQILSHVALCLPATSIVSEHIYSKPAESSSAKEIHWRHQKSTPWFFLETICDCCIAVRLGFSL